MKFLQIIFQNCLYYLFSVTFSCIFILKMVKILILFFQSLTAHVTMNKIPCALPRAILTHPAFWLVLLFDTVMLIVLSFTHV